MSAIKDNKHIEYFFISVPTFSLTVFLEILSPKIFQRHLSGVHTHLYTENSLAYLCKEYGFECMAEWWFGCDMIDLFRQVAVTLEKNGSSNKVSCLWREKFAPIIDFMQVEVDKKHFASEVHMLLRKRV